MIRIARSTIGRQLYRFGRQTRGKQVLLPSRYPQVYYGATFSPFSPTSANFSTIVDPTEGNEEGNIEEHNDVDDWGGLDQERMSSDDASQNQRLEYDEREPIELVVQRFMDAPLGSLPRRDIYLRSTDVIITCCKQRSIHGMKMARHVLHRLLDEKRSTTGLMISTEPFEKILFGWPKVNGNSATKEMGQLLSLMKKEHQWDLDNVLNDPAAEEVVDASRDSCRPTVETYNTILRGFATIAKRSDKAPYQAIQYLDEMIDLNRLNGWETKPNSKSFTHVLHALSNSGQRASARLAEELLERMLAMHEKEKKEYEEKFQVPYNMNHPIENMHQIVTPDAWVYSSVITAIVNSEATGSVDRAATLVGEWMEIGTRIDIFTFNALITGYARLAKKLGAPGKRFDVACKAHDLAELLFEKHESICTIDASLDEKERQEYWTNQLTITFNIVLNTFSITDDDRTVDQCKEIFLKIVESPKLRPDNFSLNALINACARACDGEMAQEILDFGDELYKDGDMRRGPDLISYSTVMNAWAKSSHDKKAERAREILDMLIQQYQSGKERFKPNISVYSIVLNAAQYSKPIDGDSQDDFETPDDAYSVATRTYDEVMGDSLGLNITPDAGFFTSMLEVASIHTRKDSVERRQIVTQVFDDACRAGHVSAAVIRKLRTVCPDRGLMERLLRSRDLAQHLPNVDLLSPAWTRNVPKMRKFRDLGGNRKQTRSKERRPSDPAASRATQKQD